VICWKLTFSISLSSLLLLSPLDSPSHIPSTSAPSTCTQLIPTLCPECPLLAHHRNSPIPITSQNPGQSLFLPSLAPFRAPFLRLDRPIRSNALPMPLHHHVDQHFVRQAPHLGFWQKLYESGEYKRWILYGIEAYGIFSIGEMLGRRHVVGYELDESR